MSDQQSKYINTYLDHSVGMIHEYISLVLQLKTQTKLANDGIMERDEIIKNLQNELQKYNDIKFDLEDQLNNRTNELTKTIAQDNEQMNKLRGDARKWEDDYNNMKAQVEHMNTAVNQINEMKKMVLGKDDEIKKLNETISSLKLELEKLKNPPVKTVINTKDKKPVKPVDTKQVEQVIEEKNDDF